MKNGALGVKPFAIMLIAAVVVSLGLAACGGSSDTSGGSTGGGSEGSEAASPSEEGSETASSGETGAIECVNGAVTIGIAKSKSGSATFFEVAGTNGFKVAVAKINEEGGLKGCPIKTIEGDNKSEPAVGGQVAKQLIEEGAQILVVPDDLDQGIAAAKAGSGAGILTLSLAASAPEFAPAVGPDFFSSGISTYQLGEAMANFALEKGWKTAFYANDPGLAYFTGQEKAFNETYEAGGGEIVGTDKIDSLGGQTDFSSTVSKISQANADVVIPQGVYPQVGGLVKQIRSSGIDTPIIGSTTLDTRELPKQVGPSNLKDVFYVTQVYYNGAGEDKKSDPAMEEFTEAYEKQFGHFPEQTNAPTSYQSFLAINEALQEKSVTDAATASEAISAQKNVKVPGGTLVKWEEGHAVWDPSIVGFTPTGGFELIKVLSAE